MLGKDSWLGYPLGELMLWAPGLHLGLYLPGIANIIGTDGIIIELSHFVHGTECHYDIHDSDES